MTRLDTVLYIAVKNEALVLETIASIASLSRVGFDRQTMIVVLTDQSQRFQDILMGRQDHWIRQIVYLQINHETAEEWTEDYVFSVKIKGLAYFFDNIKSNVLFFDSDTFFLKNPAPLFGAVNRGKFVLYVQNALDIAQTIKSEHWESRFLFQKEAGCSVASQTLRLLNPPYALELPLTMHHYNSGVIGLSYDQRDLLNEILEINNCIYENYQFSMSEEFAFSYIFQKRGVIQTAERFVYHYLFAKWALLFLARVLELNDCENELKIFAAENKIDLRALEKMMTSYENLPSYIGFIDSYLLNNNYILRDKDYLGGQDGYLYSLIDNRKGYRKFANCYEKYKRKGTESP